MSEHSDSFHLRVERMEHAVEWLEESHALGLVLPKAGQLVTVLVPSHHVGSVIAANHYTLVYYEFLDGERVTARLFNGPRELAHLERSFEEGTVKFDAKLWIQHRVIDRAKARMLERGLGAAWPERSERHWVADVLGLYNVTWTSGEELMTRRDELVARFPGSRLVQAGDPKLDAPRPRVVARTPPPSPTVIVSPIISRPPTPPPVIDDDEPATIIQSRAPSEPPPPAPLPAVVRVPASIPTPTPIRLESADIFAADVDADLDAALADDDDDDDFDFAAPRRERALSVLDEIDESAPRAATPTPAARTPRPRAARTTGPSPFAHLPLSDEFTDEPIGERPETEPPPLIPARTIVLCTVSKGRRELLEEDPRLVDALLEARHDETIPGLLDLGTRVHEVAMVLASIGDDLLEALRGTTARPIPGTQAKLVDRRAVVRIAAYLRRLDINDLSMICKNPRVAEDLRDLIKLYTDAAQRQHGMLIAID